LRIRALFPGTFDPIHYGHVDIARRGANLFDELVVGVYDRPIKSLLFSPEERMALVESELADISNVTVMGYQGLTVDFCHEIDAKVIIRGLRVFSDFEHEFRMALANHRLAPDVEVVPLITSEDHTFLTGTTVREIASLGGDVSDFVSPDVAKALKRRFDELGDEGSGMFSISSLRD
jgi:pantetheine-phosphate adenylyltransferase